MSPPAANETIKRVESRLGVTLPPSYKNWLTEYADGADIDLGNALFLHPLSERDASVRGSVVGQTEWWREREDCNLKELIVFGMGGVDFETYAFYTGCKDGAGEYPILWINPGRADDDGYVLLSTRFDRFLNIEVQSLLQAASSEGFDDRLWLRLYRQYDPQVLMKTPDYYNMAVDAGTVKRQATKLMNERL